jgi:hypothetical protein
LFLEKKQAFDHELEAFTNEIDNDLQGELYNALLEALTYANIHTMKDQLMT